MPLRFEPDVSHADWWAARDEPWDVLCTVGPSGYAGYVQVLMPLDGDGSDALPDDEGNLDDRTLSAVLEVLAAHTASPDDAFSCLWDGWGPVPGGPRVVLPHREYLLFRGPVAEAGDWGLDLSVSPPGAVWPADRTWFLAFDVDPDWAVVGGSAALAARLLDDSRFDSRAVRWGPLGDPRVRA